MLPSEIVVDEKLDALKSYLDASSKSGGFQNIACMNTMKCVRVCIDFLAA